MENEKIYTACKSLTILYIRYMPLIYSFAVVFAACENLYAINVASYTDYGDYIIYNTPISD